MEKGKFKEFLQKPWVQKTWEILKKIGFVLKLTAKWCYQLRSLLLSIPVLVGAVVLAIRNSRLLPEAVGLGLKGNGEYILLLSRSAAVLLPLVVTCLCVVMVFCSKKVLHPWLVSLLSLALPLAIWFSTTFPA
jgi:hypothetical protein